MGRNMTDEIQDEIERSAQHMRKQIARFMRRHNLSARALSSRAGCGETSVWDFTNGKKKFPRFDTVMRIAAVMKVSVHDLLGVKQ